MLQSKGLSHCATLAITPICCLAVIILEIMACRRSYVCVHIFSMVMRDERRPQ